MTYGFKIVSEMISGLSNYLDEQNYPDKSDRTAAALSQMRAAGEAALARRTA